MTEYHHLTGADDVRQGGNAVREGAHEMQLAVSNMDAVIERMLHDLDDFANRMESLRNPQPAPLKPCDGCVFATIMQVHNPALAEAYDVEGCRRYPTIQRVDGLGCGERQEGGK